MDLKNSCCTVSDTEQNTSLCWEALIQMMISSAYSITVLYSAMGSPSLFSQKPKVCKIYHIWGDI